MATIVVRDDGVVTAYGSGSAAPPGSRTEEVSDEALATILALYAEHPNTAGVTWDGSTAAALPDDPAKIAQEARAATQSAVRAALGSDSGSVDPSVVQAALGRLDAIIGAGSVDPLPASPTNADVVAQVRTLTTATNLIIHAVKDLARIERGIIRLLS